MLPPNRITFVLFYGFLAVVALVSMWGILERALCFDAPLATALDKKEAGSCLEFWINRYQTLIGGGLALVGALLAVWAVRAQIDQAESIERRRRASDALAARAVLPLALSSIIQYTSECVSSLRAALSQARSNTPIIFTCPALPQDVIEPLREAVRHSERKEASKLADLLAWLQIQNSRLRSLEAEVRDPDALVLPFELKSHIFDAVELHVLVSSLFDYGRRTEEGTFRPNAGFEDACSALHSYGIWDEDDPDLFKLLKLRKDQAAEGRIGLARSGVARAEPPDSAPASPHSTAPLHRSQND